MLCLSRVQRIARRLLAEGRAANYDEAEVAASLLALKFGDAEALQAAKECSSVESALAFLQQECELCTGRFAMSQVSIVEEGGFLETVGEGKIKWNSSWSQLQEGSDEVDLAFRRDNRE